MFIISRLHPCIVFPVENYKPISRLHLVLAFLLFSCSLSAQSMGRVFPHSDSTQVRSLKAKMRLISSGDMNDAQMAEYLFAEASLFIHYGKLEQGEKNVLRGMRLDSLGRCKEFEKRIPMVRARTNNKGEPLKYFTDYISFEFTDSIYNYCLDLKSNRKGVDQENSPYDFDPFNIELLKLEEADQKHRGDSIIDWESQNRLDSLNQLSLDSLFDTFGFPAHPKVSGKAQRVAWLILQHSADCDWIKKWIVRWLDAYRDKEYKGGEFLGQTIQRFFGPKGGSCLQVEKQEFILFLTERYPASYGDKFDYNSIPFE